MCAYRGILLTTATGELHFGGQEFLTNRIDLRNHRKIVVIDGALGYTGSQNIVDADFKPDIFYFALNPEISVLFYGIELSA